VPYLQREELLGDDLLQEALAGSGPAFADALSDALERAVARGTLLKGSLEISGGEQEFYFPQRPPAAGQRSSPAAGRVAPERRSGPAVGAAVGAAQHLQPVRAEHRPRWHR
jgi:hypothetical protein